MVGQLKPEITAVGEELQQPKPINNVTTQKRAHHYRILSSHITFIENDEFFSLALCVFSQLLLLCSKVIVERLYQSNVQFATLSKDEGCCACHKFVRDDHPFLRRLMAK